MATKRKTTTAIVAGVTVAALLLGGTFAWTSISQQAKNEAIVDINPGGRLHDDFNGTNKDVYVENFGDDTTGVPIFARIRLYEYMEIGQQAGDKDTTEGKKANSLVEGDTINDTAYWEIYKYDQESAFSKYWDWKLGNNVEEELPYYMPTFNKNKDSLKADINGTYEGRVDGDIVHYDDYVEYNSGSGSVTQDATYDWDSDTEDEDAPTSISDRNEPIDSADVLKESETHNVTKISTTSTVMSMAEWKALPDEEKIGPYWVFDIDGWAYWAQPIEPGKTTGLLLDSISLKKVPDDNYYYGINVVGQFATAGDIQAFNSGKTQDETWTSDAEDLFAKITNTETLVIDGVDTVEPGVPATFTATRMVAGEAAINQPTFTWTATDANGADIEGVTIIDGVLNVADTVVDGTEITVTATAGDGTAAADGETEPLKASKVVTVKRVPNLIYSLSDSNETIVEKEPVEMDRSETYNILYEIDNASDEVISINLNRDIDINTITLGESSATIDDYATLTMAEDGNANDTLNIALKGADIQGNVTLEGIKRPVIRLIIVTEYGENIHVNLLVKLTQVDNGLISLAVNSDNNTSYKPTDTITLKANDTVYPGIDNELLPARLPAASMDVAFYENGAWSQGYTYNGNSWTVPDVGTEDRELQLHVTAYVTGMVYYSVFNVTIQGSATATT